MAKDERVDSDLPGGARRWRLGAWLGRFGLVVLGGTLGTAARAALGVALPEPIGWPTGTFVVNVVGAFLLGALVALLAGSGLATSRRERLQLLLGTGVLGGFTTYSALATETVEMLGTAPGTAVAYLGATLALGGLASAAGLLTGRRRAARPPSEPT